jgi:hypothetical protein
VVVNGDGDRASRSDVRLGLIEQQALLGGVGAIRC